MTSSVKGINLKGYLNLEELSKLSFELSTAELAEYYHMSAIEIADIKRNAKSLGIEIGMGFEESKTKKCDDQVRLEVDKFIVMGDAEIPDHDNEMFDMVYTLGYEYDIKVLVINGDLLAVDAFSKFKKSSPHTKILTDDLEIATNFLNKLSTQYTTIIYLPGNHEKRLLHQTEGHLSVGDVLKGKVSDNVIFSAYSYCYIKSVGEDVLVYHPKTYSSIPLGSPRRISQSKPNCHLIAGHTHRLTIGYADDGIHWMADGGHCRDALRTSYKQMDITTYPEWTQGFIMVSNANPYKITKRNFTDYLSRMSRI